LLADKSLSILWLASEVLFVGFAKHLRSYAKLNGRIVKRYEQWMLVQHYTASTKYLYNQTIRLFLGFLKKQSLISVTHSDIRQFLVYLSEIGVSLTTARKHLLGLRKFYDFLTLGGLVNYAAPRLVSVRATPKKTPAHLSEEEIRRLIEATRTLREKALVEFFYATGCRMSEVRNLRVQDIDFGNRHARVTGKYGKTRVVLLTPSAAEALRDYVGERTIGFVFQQDYPLQTGSISNSHGAWMARWTEYDLTKHDARVIRKYLGSANLISRERAIAKFNDVIAGAHLARPKRNAPLTSTSVGSVLRRIAHRAGITRATAHMYRHSFATHLYEHGADLLAIQTLLGHVRMETTVNYAKSSAFKLTETYDRCHPLGALHVEIETRGCAS
jgi:site-specific recombinase XerD